MRGSWVSADGTIDLQTTRREHLAIQVKLSAAAIFNIRYRFLVPSYMVP